MATSDKARSQDINLVGNVTMTITRGIANGQSIPVQDATANLRVRRQTVITKITA